MYKEYFKEIFETSKSVIIPGLGSFSKTHPDDPKITFNPYLKFNDGFLAGFIARKQGIPLDEAGKLIADNVDRINETLDQKGEALVLGLGVLKKTAEGKLEFIADTQAGGNTPAPEIKKPTEQPVVKPEEKPLKPAEPQPEIKPEPKPEIKPEKEKPGIKPVEPPKKDDPKNSTVKVEAPGLTNVDNTSAKENKKEKEKKVKPSRPPKPAKPEGEKKKKKFPVVLVIVLVLLAGAGTFAALQWDMVKGWLGMNENTVAQTSEEKDKADTEETAVDTMAVTATADTVSGETPVIEEVKNEEPVKNQVKPGNKTKNQPPVQHYSNTGSNYHVIVNCFSMEQNAQRMVEKLNTEGHQGNNLGLRGGFYMVAAGSFATMEEARSKLEAVRGTYPKAWIYAGS